MAVGPAAPSASSRSTMLVGALAAASLVALLALRVWGAFALEPIHTWDDDGYRRWATAQAKVTPTGAALAAVLLPEPRHMGDLGMYPRSMGYHSALVLGRRLSPQLPAEVTWQLVNLVLLLIQLGCVYYLARDARWPRSYALTLVFVYAGCPMVFGLTRWVMTENHVFAALLVTFAAARALLAAAPPDPRTQVARQAAFGLAAGYLIGIFSTVREYAAPYQLALVLALLIALALDRRWPALIGFLGVFTPFAVALTHSLPPVLVVAIRTSENEAYAHPFGEWAAVVATYFVGWPLLLLLLAGIVGTVAWMRRVRWRRAPQTTSEAATDPTTSRGDTFFSVAVVVLATAAFIQVLFLVHRVVRAAIPVSFLLTLVGFIAARRRPPLPARGLVASAVALLMGTWATLWFQAIAPDGVRERFRHHCHALERYDYPLRMPRLPPGQQHTRCD